jgi:mannose-1-phosphate guanylyltransferase
MNPFVAVIMAGGKGQRFWPLSTTSRPKQFLDLEQGGQSLLQTTYQRILPLTGSPENVLIATGERYVRLVKEQLPDIPDENLLIEPVGRDSAPAIALASLVIEARYGNVTAGCFSSDHRISKPEVFRESIERAICLAENEQGLVTIGITPSRPATGYGYVEMGEPAGQGHKVKRFVEKPNHDVAQRYLEEGTYLWNAGIFVWSTEVILSELDRFDPELMQPLRRAFDEGRIDEVFPTLKKISIDYSVMEHTDKAFVVPGDFGWDDIGDWVALERHLKQEHETNTVIGSHVGLDASGNIVYTEDPEDIIVTLGVEDLVIVKRGNAVLLARKDRVQDIKKLLEDERLANFKVREG